MKDKLLIFIHDHIPTTEIVIRTLSYLNHHYEIKVVTLSTFKLHDLFSGEYKLLLMRIYDPSLFFLIKLFKRYQIPYLYYLDDNFWELKGNTPVIKIHQDKTILCMLTQFVANATCVVTGTQQLANYVKKFNLNTISIDASFHFPIIKNLKRKSKSNTIKIIYSGSFYREEDFKVVVDAIKMICDEFKDKVECHFHGFIPDALKNVKNVFFTPFNYRYDEYIKTLFEANFDIGIAPLSNTLSNQAKSNLKYREYGACGIAGIYSDIAPYSSSLIDRTHGLITLHSTEGWYESIKLLIENKSLRESISKNAFEDIQKNYTDEKLSMDWLRVLVKLEYPKKVTLSLKNLILYRINQIYFNFFSKIKKIKIYYQYHGFGFTFKKIINKLIYK